VRFWRLLPAVILAAGTVAACGSASAGEPTDTTTTPNLYLYTGSGTTEQPMLYAAAENGEGTAPAKVLVPGPAFIEEKFGTKIPMPSPCAYVNDDYPGWKAEPSGAGIACALLWSRSASADISNLVVLAWLPTTGGKVSQCLQYLTWTYHADDTWTSQTVDLYWDAKAEAWTTFDNNIYGAQHKYCSSPDQGNQQQQEGTS
jgi:hypothetical protein